MTILYKGRKRVSLKCPNCGNEKKFYRSISVEAKLRVNKNGDDMKSIYDIDKSNIDGWYEPIYCCECDTQVGES